MNPPIIQKRYTQNIEDEELVSGQDFFEFFEKKRLKLALSWIAGLVGIMGNYSAVRFQITQTRFDMLGQQDMIDAYAFGLTALLDLMIVVFHLMRIKWLTFGSTISAVVISLYANISLMVQNQSIASLREQTKNDLQLDGSMIVGLVMSVLPIVILTHLMHLVVVQYDQQMREAKRNVLHE